MNKEFLKYETALALKELGFDEPCFGYYPKSGGNIQFGSLGKFSSEYTHIISAPTYSQAFRWFREKYGLFPQINLHDRENEETWRITISVLGIYDLAYNQNVSKEPYYKTYEEAEQACLDKLIEIVKSK